MGKKNSSNLGSCPNQNTVKKILEAWTDENVLSLTMNGVIIRNLLNPKRKMPATFDGYQTIDKRNFILCLFDIDVTPRCVGVANDDGQ